MLAAWRDRFLMFDGRRPRNDFHNALPRCSFPSFSAFD
jgi:hypothetical protein